MENNSDFDYPALIGKYLSGEASAEEAMLLHEWLEDPGNKTLYNGILKIWDQLPASATCKPPDTFKAWENLQSHFHKSSKKKAIIKTIYRYAAAACIVAVIGALSLLWLNKENQDDKTGQQVFSNIIRSGEGQLKDTLRDGSIITMNQNTSVSLSDMFNSSVRSLKMEGEAFFDVAHDRSKPFIINVDELKIEVVGTSFNVHKLKSENLVTVQVLSGKVKMYTKERELYIIKNQTGIYNGRSGELILENNIDINSLAYATRSFVFDDITLFKACSYLEKAFNVRFDFKDRERLVDCRITAEIINKPLPYILDVLAATLNINYQQNKKTIFISGEGCK